MINIKKIIISTIEKKLGKEINVDNLLSTFTWEAYDGEYDGDVFTGNIHVRNCNYHYRFVGILKLCENPVSDQIFDYFGNFQLKELEKIDYQVINTNLLG